MGDLLHFQHLCYYQNRSLHELSFTLTVLLLVLFTFSANWSSPSCALGMVLVSLMRVGGYTLDVADKKNCLFFLAQEAIGFALGIALALLDPDAISCFITSFLICSYNTPLASSNNTVHAYSTI